MNRSTDVFRPSLEKFWEGTWTAVTDKPTGRQSGVPVDRFVSVLVSVHPSTPPLTDPTMVGAYCVVRVWRFMEESKDGQALGQGQWFAGEELSVALDGNVGLNGSMQYRVPTLQSEKMYLQLIELVDTPFGTSLVPSLTVLKLREEGAEDSCCGGSVSSSGGGSVDTEFDGPTDDPLPNHAVYEGARARSVQALPVSADDNLVGLVANLRGELVLAGYDWLALALRNYRVNPEWEHHDETSDIIATPLDAASGAPIVAYIDLTTFQHHSLQVLLSATPGAPADLCAIDFAFSNRVTNTPGTIAAGDWTTINDKLAGTAGNAPITNAFGDVSQVYLANGFSGQWLRVRAWRVSGAVGNVSAEVLRTSWY